ncbi:MAG: DUF1286 domain-containing protein [Nitrososphaerota archaeon]|nr:DUF1286 domain-containing protein [Nitrososphaerota archaeon]
MARKVKEATHIIFSLGTAFLITSAFLRLNPGFQGGSGGVLFVLAAWLAFSVNHVVDSLGHDIVYTGQGERLPVRSWRTHSVFTTPLWGVLVGSASVLGVWFLLSEMMGPIIPAPKELPAALALWASFLGAAVAYTHLLPDSLTQAGVYYWKKRAAIAHWRYDSFLGNALFIIVGLGFLAAAFRLLNV